MFKHIRKEYYKKMRFGVIGAVLLIFFASFIFGVIGGLLAATVLTLVVVPVLCYSTYRLWEWLRAGRGAERSDDPAAEGHP